MMQNNYDKLFRELFFSGSLILSQESNKFNKDIIVSSITKIYDFINLSCILNALGFAEKYIVLDSDSIYTNYPPLIDFCKKFSLTLKIYHNFISEKVDL